MTCRALLCILLLQAGPPSLAPAQETAPPPAPPAAAPSPEEREPKAAEILAAAVKAQNGGEFASKLADFRVALRVLTRDKAGRLETSVKREFLAPNSIWTEIDESASGQHLEEGTDGHVCWARKAGKVTLYEGPDFKTDRKRIKLDLELMKLMLRVFFLQNLVADLQDARHSDDQVLERKDPTDPKKTIKDDCFVITGSTDRLPEDVGGPASVKLWIDRASSRLVRVRLEPKSAEHDALELRLFDHVANAQGIVVPQNVDVYRGDGKDPWQQLSLDGAEDAKGDLINNIVFNAGIDPSRFAPPKGDDAKNEKG